MAQLVNCIALAHAPGITGWIDKAEAGQRDRLAIGYGRLAKEMAAATPDVVIAFGNDHMLNLPLDNLPLLCVGTGSQWQGPAPWFQDWLDIAPFSVPGRPDVAEALVQALDRRGLSLAFREDMLFDDNFSVPLTKITPGYSTPFIPVLMNCLVPPVATPRACFDMGALFATAIREDLPAGLRVALMGTGGLSHDPGGPLHFGIDEDFDRWFLSLLEQGDTERAFAECTLERMQAAGAGGTQELIAWFLAWGAAGGEKAEIVCYEPTVNLRCSVGAVSWKHPSII